MRHILTTTNPGESGGCSMLDDGTRIFWAEGRSSELIVLKADGTKERLENGGNPLADAFNTLCENGLEPQREMTALEAIEYDSQRNE
jgi:hypothetical protein